MSTFHARGKLLLSAEYLVLHGAQALAVPLTRGQSMEIEARGQKPFLEWQAADSSGPWFQATIDPVRWRIVESSNNEVAGRLMGVLRAASELAPAFREELPAKQVNTFLDYPRNFGFGSSSTLISLVAQWSACDPMALHRRISGGSGYDVACATAAGPILYRLEGEENRTEEADFAPPFQGQVYFAWLGHKQDTGESLRELGQGFRPGQEAIQWFSEISRSMVRCNTLEEFRSLMDEHEDRLSMLLGKVPVYKRFGGLEASVKSLGAWGGDFVMIATPLEEDDLLRQLESFGLRSVYRFKDLVYDAKA